VIRHDGPLPVQDERLLPEQRLRRRADYQRCYRDGQRRHGSLANLHFIANETGMHRLGITASRKVGNSVVRHLLKRRVRETFRRWPGRHRLGSRDLVVHLKPAAKPAAFEALERELLRLFKSLGSPRPPGSRETGPREAGGRPR
jgi:ribonuclease P protein component